MSNLVLILYLRNDPDNTLASKINHLCRENRMQSLAGRADALLLSDNSALFALPDAHEIFSQLCAGLVEGAHPYLIVPIASNPPYHSGALAVGKFPEEVQAILLGSGVSFASRT
jgi:hypothetical protein